MLKRGDFSRVITIRVNGVHILRVRARDFFTGDFDPFVK